MYQMLFVRLAGIATCITASNNVLSQALKVPDALLSTVGGGRFIHRGLPIYEIRTESRI